jgi:hypothetical protein
MLIESLTRCLRLTSVRHCTGAARPVAAQGCSSSRDPCRLRAFKGVRATAVRGRRLRAAVQPRQAGFVASQHPRDRPDPRQLLDIDRWGVTKRGEHYTEWKALPAKASTFADVFAAADLQLPLPKDPQTGKSGGWSVPYWAMARKMHRALRLPKRARETQRPPLGPMLRRGMHADLVRPAAPTGQADPWLVSLGRGSARTTGETWAAFPGWR